MHHSFGSKLGTKIVEKLSNGYLPANLANSSTRAKLAVFGECEYSPKRPFSEIYRVLARLADIRQMPFLRKM
jgi:hypothetical protein